MLSHSRSDLEREMTPRPVKTNYNSITKTDFTSGKLPDQNQTQV